MSPNKIIPEGKQKNKPVNPPPVTTPEIIPETLCPFLNSPKPTLNTIPQPESYMNKIQSQRLKSRLVPLCSINQKNWPPLTGFQNNQEEIPGNPIVSGACNPDCELLSTSIAAQRYLFSPLIFITVSSTAMKFLCFLTARSFGW